MTTENMTPAEKIHAMTDEEREALLADNPAIKEQRDRVQWAYSDYDRAALDFQGKMQRSLEYAKERAESDGGHSLADALSYEANWVIQQAERMNEARAKIKAEIDTLRSMEWAVLITKLVG